MDEDDYRTVLAMLTFGGGFVTALARAAQAADADNLAKIKAAWPQEWAQYQDMARMVREREA